MPWLDNAPNGNPFQLEHVLLHKSLRLVQLQNFNNLVLLETIELAQPSNFHQECDLYLHI